MSEVEKYYWCVLRFADGKEVMEVCKKHPFEEFQYHWKSKNGVLLNFKEISKEEYDLFLKYIPNNMGFIE